MAAVALGLFLQLGGCLNPRPEELPSGTTSNNVPGVERESCGSNPLLAGCELPDMDINGTPVAGDGVADQSDEPGAAAPGAPAPESPPESLGGGGQDAGAAASAETDAGSLGDVRDASDAGAP
jgi:hypothetical protein